MNKLQFRAHMLGHVETYVVPAKSHYEHIDVDCITCRKSLGILPTTRSKISLQCQICINQTNIKNEQLKLTS